MEILLGFAIAVLIGLTGVGGGVVTAPLLTLFLGVPAVESVGTALIFTAVVKCIAAPIYIVRRQVNFRILGVLLLGGLPGVVTGSLLLSRLNTAGHQGPLLGVLGCTVVLMAAINLYRLLAPRGKEQRREHHGWLALLALPIGAEVGFSSAGAGALGSLALMNFTSIPIGQVVGTDLLFGLGLSLTGGSISLKTGNYQGLLALKLAIGGLIGAYVGARLLSWLPSRPLRIALSLWLAAMGSQLCWRAIG